MQQKSIANPFGVQIEQVDDESESFWGKDSNIDINLQSQPSDQQISKNNPKQPSKQQQSQQNLFTSNSLFQQQQQNELQGNINMQEVPELNRQGSSTNSNGDQYDEQGNLIEPPLLEDIGIDLELIKNRTISVLLMKNCDEKFWDKADMIGPSLLSGVLGILLLMTGKVHFGYIFGFWISGAVSLYIVLNYISPRKNIPLYNVVSILGYCLIPIVFLAFFTIIFKLFKFNMGTYLFALFSVFWSTYAASAFFNEALQLHHQRVLTGYPTFLFYATFVLITIF